jgi:hypothetical protein
MENLADSKTYYWRVIPRLNDLEGSCISGIWWFEVDLSKAGLEKIHKLKITGRDSISIYPGENKSITLSITNLGEAKDTIRLELEAGKLSDYIYLEDRSLMELESNSYALRELNIEPPMDIKPGTHVIIITAISVNSGEIVRESHVLEIEILELESQPADSGPNGIDTNGTAGNKTKEKSAGWLNEIMLISIILIIVMIILLLVVAMFIKKRKKRAEQELLAPGTFAFKPGALPSPVITLEQVGGAPAVQQLPGTAAAGVSTQPTTVTTLVPTLASAATAAQAPPPQQMPQVPQLPQLPPAQTQAPTAGAGDEEITPVPTATTPASPAQQATPSQTTAPTVSKPSIIQPTIASSTPTIVVQPLSTPTTGPAVHLLDSAPQQTIATPSQTPPSVVGTTPPTQTPTVTTPTPSVVQQPPQVQIKEPPTVPPSVSFKQTPTVSTPGITPKEELVGLYLINCAFYSKLL